MPCLHSELPHNISDNLCNLKAHFLFPLYFQKRQIQGDRKQVSGGRGLGEGALLGWGRSLETREGWLHNTWHRLGTRWAAAVLKWHWSGWGCWCEGHGGCLGCDGAEDSVTANGLAGRQDMVTGAGSRGQGSSLPKKRRRHSWFFTDELI